VKGLFQAEHLPINIYKTNHKPDYFFCLPKEDGRHKWSPTPQQCVYYAFEISPDIWPFLNYQLLLSGQGCLLKRRHRKSLIGPTMENEVENEYTK
jgi:hypothetical protein